MTASVTGGTIDVVAGTPAAGDGLLHTQFDDADRGLLTFSFDVQSITFDYLGLGGGAFLAEALDINGNVVDTFTDPATTGSISFDGQNIVLDGGGIRALRFADTPGSSAFVIVDNVDLEVANVQQVPLPATLVLVAGLIGVGAVRAWSRRR